MEYLFVDVCTDETTLPEPEGCIAPGVGALTDRYEYLGPYHETLLLRQME